MKKHYQQERERKENFEKCLKASLETIKTLLDSLYASGEFVSESKMTSNSSSNNINIYLGACSQKQIPSITQDILKDSQFTYSKEFRVLSGLYESSKGQSKDKAMASAKGVCQDIIESTEFIMILHLVHFVRMLWKLVD